jgi:hypothetical protein
MELLGDFERPPETALYRVHDALLVLVRERDRLARLVPGARVILDELLSAPPKQRQPVRRVK